MNETTTRCFDIGGSKILSADVTAGGHIDVLSRLPTPSTNFEEFTQALAKLCPNQSEPISISIAGVIHPKTGKVKSANIPCISDRHLAVDLENALSRQVHIINDANAFALAEAQCGQARNHDVVLAIILGTGIGGGIVVKGQVLSGSDGSAGEWGHGPASAVRTGYSLPRLNCNCGQITCVDTIGGARGLERLYQQIMSETLSSQEIVRAWETGESSAIQVLDVWLDVVGGALANVVNFLGPSIVAVGGGLANSTALVNALDQEVSARRLAEQQSGLLYSAVYGPEQALIGASLHAQNHLR